jgi:hypothetical protein
MLLQRRVRGSNPVGSKLQTGYPLGSRLPIELISSKRNIKNIRWYISPTARFMNDHGLGHIERDADGFDDFQQRPTDS